MGRLQASSLFLGHAQSLSSSRRSGDGGQWSSRRCWPLCEPGMVWMLSLRGTENRGRLIGREERAAVRETRERRVGPVSVGENVRTGE